MGTVDGPGIRCVVFMQGCPLRCKCCHNPDTWDFNGGYEADSGELAKKILRYKAYFGKKGGVTVSGGEPLCQAEFTLDLFRQCHKNGINTCLDTSGCRLDEGAKALLKETDLVLLDYKYSRDEDYLKYTLCKKENVLNFLFYLEKNKIPAIIRRVIIPGLNDDEESYRDLANVTKWHTCVLKTELLPFRKLCLEKYEQMGLDFPLKNSREPSQAEIDADFGRFM